MYLNLTVTTSEDGILCYKNLRFMQDPDLFNARSDNLDTEIEQIQQEKYCIS